jgi:dynein heavy chain
MLSQLKPEFHIHASVNMNFYTTAAVLLVGLEASLQKRTGSTYGPPGSAKLVYFIDDLNLPEVAGVELGHDVGLAVIPDLPTIT